VLDYDVLLCCGIAILCCVMCCVASLVLPCLFHYISNMLIVYSCGVLCALLCCAALVIAGLLFMVIFRVGTYLCLKYILH